MRETHLNCNDQITGETKAQIYISWQQIKLPVPGMGCILSNCWPQGLHGIAKITQANAKSIGCYPHTDDKALPLKTTHT